MKIQKNSRQIPKTKKYTARKEYNDIMYSFLQTVSYRTKDGKRWYDPMPFNELGAALGISRQTASKRFKQLVDLNLLIKYEDKYEIPCIPNADAFLVPQDTLRWLVNSLSTNSVTIYVYLINRYIANKEKPFVFTFNSLKEQCGLSIKTRSNNIIITDILKTLLYLNLIEIDVETSNENDQIKTKYTLKSASLEARALGNYPILNERSE